MTTYKVWKPEDGFGGEEAGKGTIMEQFDDMDALVFTPEERKEQLIKDTIEVDLMLKLQSFKTKLCKTTPMHKFELLINWLESITVETVVKRQTRSKLKAELLRNSVTLEESQDVRGVLFVGSTVAKSSLLGQDPFGDKKELPRTCYEYVQVDADATTDEDGGEVTVNLEAKATDEGEAEADEGADEAPPPATQRKVREKRYTPAGLLLKKMQEECRDLIKVMIYYLVGTDLESLLRDEEATYRNSEEKRKSAPRGTMPWSAYKEVIRKRLLQAPGWRELKAMCATKRPIGSIAMQWFTILCKGKEKVERYGHRIADKAYVNKAMHYLLYEEDVALEMATFDYHRANNEEYTREDAAKDLAEMSWDAFVKLARKILANSKKAWTHRMAKLRDPGTNPKAGARKSVTSKTKGSPGKTNRKRTREAKGKPCAECTALGLVVQAGTHTTSECDPARRQ